MKRLKFLTNCVGLVLLTITNISYSDSFWSKVRPFAGVDAKYWYIEGRGDYDPALHRNHFGGSGYLGTNITDRFSLEAGYEVGFKRHKDANLTVIGGDSFSSPARVATDQRLRTIYAEGHFYWRTVSPDIMMIFALGVSRIEPIISLVVNNVNRSVTTNPKYVVRVGYGGEYQIFSWLAARSLLRYENTERAEFAYNNQFGQRDSGRWLKDSLSLSLGLLLTWPKCK